MAIKAKEKTFFSVEVYFSQIRMSECAICLNLIPDAIISPCGHKEFCSKCLFVLITTNVRRCPICRGEILCYNLRSHSFTLDDLKEICRPLMLCINRDFSFMQLCDIPGEDDFYFNDRQCSLAANGDYIRENYERIKFLFELVKDSNAWKWLKR